MDIKYPDHFLLPDADLNDIPSVKLWSARFFVNQLKTLWSIKIPTAFPERLAFVSLIDAIIGEIISSRDALKRSLGNEIRTKGVKSWKYDILDPIEVAFEEDNWLDRILTLRNEGLHGNYLPEEIRVWVGSVSDVDMRLVKYRNGIVADIDLPDDFELVCKRMETLINECREQLAKAVHEKATGNPDQQIADFFRELPSR